MLILCKVHESSGRRVLAACDLSLLGKKIKHAEIEFEVRRGFYGGEKISGKKLAGLLREHDNINLVGHKVVGIALREKIVAEERVLMLGEVPHVQVFRI